MEPTFNLYISYFCGALFLSVLLVATIVHLLSYYREIQYETEVSWVFALIFLTSFIIVGGALPNYESREVVKPQIAKTDNFILVSYQGTYVASDQVNLYTADSLKVTYVKSYNFNKNLLNSHIDVREDRD